MISKYPENLNTERLSTRFLKLEDIETWKKYFEDKEAMRFINNRGLTDITQLSKSWIERQLWRYSAGKGGFHALIHEETNEFIGQCGILVQDVNGVEMVEIGYHLFSKYWGHGYATEAAIMFKNYAFENNITDKVVSLININNIASQRVANRNGMSRGEQIWWFDQDIYVYSVSK